jgi:hypothetical protein
VRNGARKTGAQLTNDLNDQIEQREAEQLSEDWIVGFGRVALPVRRIGGKRGAGGGLSGVEGKSQVRAWGANPQGSTNQWSR